MQNSQGCAPPAAAPCPTRDGTNSPRCVPPRLSRGTSTACSLPPTHDKKRLRSKHQTLTHLTHHHTIVTLHGCPAVLVELRKAFPLLAIYGFIHEITSFGSTIFVKKVFLPRFTHSETFTIQPARILRVLLTGEPVNLNIVAVHSGPTEPADRRKTHLTQAFGSACADFCTFVLGDLNAVFPGDGRLNINSLVPEPFDDPLGKWLHDTWPTFLAIAYDGYSRVG